MIVFQPISRIRIPGFVIVFCILIGIIASNALAAQVTLAWDPNTESDLAGYRIHYGTASGSYTVHTDVRKVTSYTVTGLTAGQTYYFVLSAYDTSGNESGYSNQVGYSITASNVAPSAPSAPSGPASAPMNASASFSTSATDPNGDSLQYRYDWGGGVLSDWGTAGQSHSWAAAGQYAVKAQARDSVGVESVWSGAKMVAITQSSAPVVTDSDGDGVPDSRDVFPNDPKEWADANGNGIGDNAEAAAAAAKQAPDAPLLVSPVSNAVASVMAALKTDAFRTAVAGATHAKSRWQVFRNEDDACVLDIQSSTALTSLTVPKPILDEGTPYFWRVQFIDSKGAASAWSDYEDFVTNKTNADLNANGIPDTQEVASTADLDMDGVQDNLQKTIKSVKMVGSSVQIGVSIKGSPTALAIESVESEDPGQTSSYASSIPKIMPFGLINFKIAVAHPGDEAVVKLHFSEAASLSGTWYKYDPIDDTWHDFSAYAQFAPDRRSVTLTLRDGGPGDADGVANGVIVDPAGIVEVEEESSGVVDNPSSTSIAGSGGGHRSGIGCFVATAMGSGVPEIPVSFLSLIALLILLSLMHRVRTRALHQGLRRK